MRENTSRVTGAFTTQRACEIVAEAIRRPWEEMASGAWLTVASDKRQAMVSKSGDGTEWCGNGFQVEAKGLRQGRMCSGMGTRRSCAPSGAFWKLISRMSGTADDEEGGGWRCRECSKRRCRPVWFVRPPSVSVSV